MTGCKALPRGCRRAGSGGNSEVYNVRGCKVPPRSYRRAGGARLEEEVQ